MKYAARSGRIDVFARRISDVRPVEVTLSLPTRSRLATRERAPATIHMAGFGSRLSFEGTLSRNPDLALSGKLDANVQDALERALGLVPDDRRVGQGVEMSVSATVTLDPRGGGLEGLTIKRGPGQLSGIAAFREDRGRWSISSTLAGDLVDGTAAHNALQRVRAVDGQWSPRALDVNPMPGLDLDIRLSTRVFKLGPISLENAALSIFTRAGRAEFAIADSQFGPGNFKARVAVTEAPHGQDMRLTIAGDKLDSEAFLDRVLGLGRLRGPAHLVVQAESRGRSVRDLISNLVGNGSLNVTQGEIAGIDLNRLMTRSVDQRSEVALIGSLGGRSPFQDLAVSFAFRNGRIEPTGSRFLTPSIEGSLDGFVDLLAQENRLSGFLRRREPLLGQPSEFFAFRIIGPIFQPNVKPDPALLLRRSDAISLPRASRG